MLLEFGLKNYFCFREGVSISFELDKHCPADISLGRNFTPALCIKGANGSGKSHLLKGLCFLADFAAASFSNQPDALLPIATFFDSDQPSEFYAEFSIDNIGYLYELCANNTQVIRETLYRTKSRRAKILERLGNEITYKIKQLEHLETIKLRKNVSIFSTAHQYELDELTDVYRFFSLMSSNLDRSGQIESPLDIKLASHFLSRNQHVFAFVKEFIAECDVGIADIKIESVTNSLGKPEFFPVFYHHSGGKLHGINEIAESNGTTTLFRNLGLYRLILDSGGVLILDEFDINLHPHILPKLLKLFFDPETNPKNAQIIFSTHNSEILNLLGRYRSYLVNKEENESYAYRLDEIPGDILRNDRPILPAYNDSKIGGVPKI